MAMVWEWYCLDKLASEDELVQIMTRYDHIGPVKIMTVWLVMSAFNQLWFNTRIEKLKLWKHLFKSNTYAWLCSTHATSAQILCLFLIKWDHIK